MRSIITPLLLAALALGSACPSGPPVSLLGEWGGDHIRLAVSDRGASVELDCAHGSIDAPLVLDDRGRFAASGVFVREHGGPVRVGEVPDAHPARYAGVVDDDAMQLTISLLDDPTAAPMRYALVHGQPGRVFKCL